MRNETQNRRDAIKSLIQEMHISDQQQLVALLKILKGIETNQAVVSRDIRHLGVVKKTVKGAIAYELAETNVDEELLKLAIIEIEHNECMIVIKTHAGLAAFVGDCIDENKESGILGCIAGENTVFVTPRSIKDIRHVYENLCKNLYFKHRI